MTRRVVATDFGGPEKLVLVDEPTPEPGPDEVRVGVRAIGVNPIDWKLYSGNMSQDPAMLRGFGREVAGVVDAVGDGVEGWQVGDAVVVPVVAGGSYADVVVAPASALLAKPEGLSFEQAAAATLVGGTAAHLVEAIGTGPGDTVLVHGGAGGVGGIVVQLAVRRGARVIATASPANHDYLRSLGAEPVEYGDGLVDRVRALAPDGVDAVADTMGSVENLDLSVELVADRQRIATIGSYAHAVELGAKALYGGPGGEPGLEIRANAWPEVLALVASGDLELPIAATYPLEETAAAHTASRAGHTRGKIVVVP